MSEQIKITVKYFRLKKYLMEELGYSSKTAAVTISDIRRMVPPVRKAFLVWFTTGKKPQGELCGIHYENLLTYRDLNPVSAFLAIDWYVKDPKEAYAMLAMPSKDQGKKAAEPASSEMAELLKRFSVGKMEPEENTEDVTE